MNHNYYVLECCNANLQTYMNFRMKCKELIVKHLQYGLAFPPLFTVAQVSVNIRIHLSEP